MRQIGNWDKVQAATERQQLPPGGYVCKIMDAVVKTYYGRDNNPFEKLEISIEIIEGEHKDFFSTDYRGQPKEDKRWRGVLRLYVPTEDGSDKDEWTQKRLKAATNAVEESNAGYCWDWNETAMKGKLVGAIFRSEEWEMSGRSGWATRCCGFYSVEQIRSGKFKVPEPFPIKRGNNGSSFGAATQNGGFQAITGADDDLPF